MATTSETQPSTAKTPALSLDDTAGAKPGGWRDKTLKIAGISLLAAESSLFISGRLKKDTGFTGAALSGITGGVIGSTFGNPTAENQLHDIYLELGDYLRQKGVEIPTEATPEALAKKGGLIDHTTAFLRKRSPEIMNLCFAAIGGFFILGAKQRQIPALYKSGGFMIAGALAGLLIKEKQRDPANPATGLGKITEWVQEKPMRLTGMIHTANQVFLLKAGIDDFKRGKATNEPNHLSGFIFHLISCAFFNLGNLMIALSSKSEGGAKPLPGKEVNDLLETSARVAAAQPQEVREAMIGEVAAYLARKPNVGLTAEQISARMQGKLAEIGATQPQPGGWEQRTAGRGSSEGPVI